MTVALVGKTLVDVITESPSQDYTHPDNDTSLTYDQLQAFAFYTNAVVDCRNRGVSERINFNSVLPMSSVWYIYFIFLSIAVVTMF